MAYAMVAHEAGDSKVFKKENIEVPKPGKGEVLLRHTAIGVNFLDVYQRSGVYPPPGGYPAIFGNEAAGVVQGVGAGVTGFLSLIHISEPTRRTPISYAVFCLK